MDNDNGRVRNLVLPDTSSLSTEFRPNLLNGVQVITARAVGLAYDANGTITKHDQTLTAIPYYAWANRGRGQMAVWLARTESAARPTPFPSIASASTVTSSGRRNPRAVNDGETPENSADPTSYFDWWPRRGTSEWLEYAFATPTRVSGIEVYWFDDTGSGQVRVPASWRVLYKAGDTWTPVEAKTPYGTAKDAYNAVAFAPVTTSGLRLEVTSQPEFSSGVQEWTVRR